MRLFTCMILGFFHWIWKFHFRPWGRSQGSFGNKPVKDKVKFTAANRQLPRDGKQGEERRKKEVEVEEKWILTPNQKASDYR